MTSAEIAAAAKTEESIVERLMFACAANGIFKLTKPAADGSPRFINTALSGEDPQDVGLPRRLCCWGREAPRLV